MSLTRSRVRLLRRIATRKGREAEALVLLEGPRVVETAFEHGAEILFVVEAPSGSGERGRWADCAAEAGVEVVREEASLLDELSDTEHPQRVLAVAREPLGSSTLPPPSMAGSERVIVLDAVQDPGNVGTLVRSAAGLGLDRVIALEGTADPWGAKAVRASAGLVFALPVHTVAWERARPWMDQAGIPVLVAEAGGENVRRWLGRESGEPGSANDGWALLLGNEGAGPRPDALSSARARLAVPLARGIDSMNVAMAGTILMWALTGVREPEAGG